MNERVHMKRRQITKQLCRLRRAVFKTIRSLDEGKLNELQQSTLGMRYPACQSQGQEAIAPASRVLARWF